MAASKSNSSVLAVFTVTITVCSLIGATVAADAPAPAPASSAGSICPSFVGCAVTVLAFVFGSALRI